MRRCRWAETWRDSTSATAWSDGGEAGRFGGPLFAARSAPSTNVRRRGVPCATARAPLQTIIRISAVRNRYAQPDAAGRAGRKRGSPKNKREEPGMRRIVCLCLLAALLAGLTGASVAEGARDSLAVGTLTQMSGMFFTDCWGNNTADLDVRALLHGYSTVAMQSGGQFGIDATVCTAEYADDASGNRTYTFYLNPDLLFSDGSPITARDYAFSVLLLSGPEMAALGGSNLDFAHLSGFDAYSSGDGKAFSGVRLIDEHTFSLTVAADALPFFTN